MTMPGLFADVLEQNRRTDNTSFHYLMTTAKANSQFSPQQVVCLEQNQRRLYASVIQFVPVQETYWLRPLCLVENWETQPQIISLHQTSDVIVPKGTCREAWDTEILEFWTALYEETESYRDNEAGRAELHRFLREFRWQ
jgi:hypothetical protein